MSTTNIDEQKIIIQQIDSSDTITQFMEKCNNNFTEIAKFGGGPAGVQGEQGSQGVPTKPKVPIHVWKKGEQYKDEEFDEISEKFKLNLLKEDELKNTKYQVGHLIVLENAHVYILEVVDNKLTPKYILTLQSYDHGSVVDGKSAYVHIAFANLQDGVATDFILSDGLIEDSNDRKYMGIYSDDKEEPSTQPQMYTWVKIVGNNGEKGEKGDTPIQKSVKAIGYSLSDLDLNSSEWKPSISELGTLEPCTNIYIKNEYTWSDGSGDESKTYVTYGKTVTMTGTKGDTGRVLFYLGSFKDDTLSGDDVTGYLNEYRCDYYIDATGQAWMRTGTSENAKGHKDGSNDDDWIQSEKIGFLQDGAISADMINNNSFSKKTFDAVNAKEINADNINADNIKSENISSIDGNSWLNLKKSEFSFNNGGLSYINGKLHIGGLPNLPNIGGQNLLEHTSFHYEYKLGEKVAFTKIYTLDAGKKYIATHGKFEDNADSDVWASGVCLVLSKSADTDTESIKQVVKFGEPFEVNDNGKYLYIAWGSYEYLDTVNGSSFGDIGEITTKLFTQYLDQVMLQEGEIATGFQDTIAKYDYLTRVLNDGSTDIEGGLVMTNVLGLKDIQINQDGTTEQVIAGMSGVKDDNVLLWGGGTYEEAVYAASTDNDFYVGENKSGRQITSLLKKDGQGKIGIFHIEEDQVQVKTNDGNVVIDDIDGLSCKIESQEHAAVLVTPKELKTFEELKKLGESINRNYEYPSPFNNDISYTIHESFGPKYGFSNRISFKVFVGSGGTIKISGNIKYTTSQIDDRYNQGPNKISIGSQSYDGISCEIYNSKGEQINKTNTFVSDDGRSFINITVPTADTYTIEAYARIYIDFDLHMLEQNELESGIEVGMTLLEGKNIYNEYNTYLSIETNYQIAEQQTMVAYKGIFSYQGDKAYFYYKDGVGLDCQIGNVRFSVNDKGILINGLQEGSSGLTKGMLYSSNGTLKIVQ